METSKVKTGIFIILSIGVLIFLYVFFTEFKIAKQRYYYEVEVEDASWLERGDIVTVMGINMGRVEKLWIEKDKVIIRFFVDGIKLRDGTEITVENQGFLGRKRLIVKQGSGKELPSGTRFKGKTGWDLGILLQKGEQIIDSIGTLLSKAKELILNLKSTNKVLKEETEKVSKEILGFLKEWEKTGKEIRKLGESMRSISGLTEKIDSLLTIINKKEGTFQKLIKDPSLYMKMDSLLRETKKLIEDIKKNPKKYLKIEIF
jgi:phospholipid/cholesterol/gamma-HCH transport system substrate-binding protein